MTTNLSEIADLCEQEHFLTPLCTRNCHRFYCECLAKRMIEKLSRARQEKP